MRPGRGMGDLRGDRQFQGDAIPTVALRFDMGGVLCVFGIYAGVHAIEGIEN